MPVALSLCCQWFDSVWQGALHGGISAFLGKCLFSDHDVVQIEGRKCLIIVLLLCI